MGVHRRPSLKEYTLQMQGVACREGARTRGQQRQQLVRRSRRGEDGVEGCGVLGAAL
jgi:hypothetical protein